MNRIASRAFIVFILVIGLVSGMIFFGVEYAYHAESWVLKPGSPHVYDGDRLGVGVITDRTGKILLDLTDEGRQYSNLVSLRRSSLHWVGDREGNIPSTLTTHYAAEMAGYSPLTGTYQYADSSGQMVLSIHGDIQNAALEAMQDKKGTVAVYNYKTGEILCAVTTPNFDPDDVPDIAGDTTGAYEGVYVNRFMRSKYIPGSIFKIVTLAAALESIPDIAEQTFSCAGQLELTGGKVTCERIHGEQTLKEAFCNSCNCAFAQITLQIGRDSMEHYVQKFGLEDVIKFDGMQTTAGNYDISGASDQQFAWSGIGQYTDQVNPCNYMRFVGAVANDGKVTDPYLVSKIVLGGTHTYDASSNYGDRIMSSETTAVIREYMQNNVDNKYGAGNFPELTVCAKSGTGEVGGEKRPNAMFTGFVAEPDLPLAFIVCVEDGGYGASVCVPILSKVLEACKVAYK